MQKRIAFFELTSEEESYFRKHSEKKAAIYIREPLSERTLKKAENAEILCIFVHSHLNKSILAHLPKVKHIITRSVGTDHIDADFCTQNNIEIHNIPNYGAHVVAEHAFTLMLALARDLKNAQIHSEKSIPNIAHLTSLELKGKTLGVIGTGLIGTEVLKRAKAFGMHLVASDRHPNAELKKLGVAFAPFVEVLKRADVLSLHVPLTKETHHMINKQALDKLKSSAFVINTARGPLIDTLALHSALKKNKIAAAGLDVFEAESMIRGHSIKHTMHWHKHDKAVLRATHELMRMPNVMMTPHIAYYSKESQSRILQKTAEIIKNIN